jgi:L-asparagine transporter-like permease
MNTNLYLSTRMLFSLARAQDAPALLGTVSRRGTPFYAALASTLGVLAIAMTAYFSSKAYNYLLGIALLGAILTWIIILVTHLFFRRQYPAQKLADLPVHAPLFPFLQFMGIGLLIAVIVTMGLDTEFWNVAIIVGVPWVVIVSIFYLVRRARRRRLS